MLVQIIADRKKLLCVFLLLGRPCAGKSVGTGRVYAPDHDQHRQELLHYSNVLKGSVPEILVIYLFHKADT